MNRRIIFIAGGLLLAAIAISSLTSVVAWHGHHGHGQAWAERHDKFSPGAEWRERESERWGGAHPTPPFLAKPPLPPEPVNPFEKGELRHGWDGRGPFKPFGLPLMLRVLANIAVLFGLGLLLRTLAPQRLSTMIAALDAPPPVLLRHGLTGLATILATGALAVLAVISVLGVPLVPLLAFGVAVSTLVGVSTVAAALGQRIRARSDALDPNPNADLLLGLLVFGVVALVPGLNLLALGAVALLGLGVLVATRGGASVSPAPETTEL